MKCKICKKESAYLESHHIIPKSRGGNDSDSNLIKICSKCHGLAHDVSFSNDRGGLVKEALDEKIRKYEIAKKWLDDNEDFVHDKLMDVYYNDKAKWELMIILIESNRFSCDNIMAWAKGGKVKFRPTFTF